MAPYREKKQGTPSSGFPHPLEVTRTTSNNSMNHSLGSVPESPTGSISRNSVLECDYDTNPTVLYQAIEAKQWEYAISLLEGTKKSEETEASSTWVVRKEANGKLRWRLLPLHAAIIFGSPCKLIELLLLDYPSGAQCKDDRGMLPLHLAFRCQASWDVIDELITAYPLGVFVSERKGRTPLQCVSKTMPPPNSNSSNNLQSLATDVPSGNSFKTVAGVLDLYSSIVISGERKRVEQETRNLAATSISQIQDSHHRQLEAMRKKMDADRQEAKHQRESLENENQQLKQRLEQLEKQLEQRDQSHLDMTKKLRLTNVKLDLATERADTTSSSQVQHKSVDKMLRRMAESMVRQQKQYHGRVQKLLGHYSELIAEREQLRSMFLKDSKINSQKEALLLQDFRNWFREEDKKLMLQERSLVVPSASADCRTDFQKEKSSCEMDTSRPTTPKSITTHSVSVPTISSTAIAAKKSSTPSISRKPLSEDDNEERSSENTDSREEAA